MLAPARTRWRSARFGSRDVADGVLRGIERDRLLEGEAAFQRCRLLARPGANLRLLGAGGEVGVGLSFGDTIDGTAHTHLPVHRLPVEHERGQRLRVQFLPFLAVHVGIEHETALIDPLQEHHARIWKAGGIDGGEGHGGRITWFGGRCLGQPGGK
jgi:hypothetical protein